MLGGDSAVQERGGEEGLEEVHARRIGGGGAEMGLGRGRASGAGWCLRGVNMNIKNCSWNRVQVVCRDWGGDQGGSGWCGGF